MGLFLALLIAQADAPLAPPPILASPPPAVVWQPAAPRPERRPLYPWVIVFSASGTALTVTTVSAVLWFFCSAGAFARSFSGGGGGSCSGLGTTLLASLAAHVGLAAVASTGLGLTARKNETEQEEWERVHFAPAATR